MFKQAYRNDIILRNPVDNTTTPTEQGKKQRRVLSAAEQSTFLDYSKESDFEVLFYVGFSTGMRIGEILALQWKNVDMKKNEIHVEGTLVKVDGKEYRKGPTKTACSVRTIPILPEVSAKLRELRKKQIEYRLMLGGQWTQVAGLEELVFPTPFGRPTSRGVIYQAIDRIIKVIKFETKK